MPPGLRMAPARGGLVAACGREDQRAAGAFEEADADLILQMLELA